MVVSTAKTYNVGGVRLARPFKVRRLGHVGFSLRNFDAGLRFYRQLLGFRISDVIDYSTRVPSGTFDGLGDPRNYFMRYAGDHHSLVIGNKQVADLYRKLRQAPEAQRYTDPLLNPAKPAPSDAGIARRNPLIDIGQMSWQVDTLAETVDAYHWLREQGVPINRVGRDMPGSNWHTYFNDPDGHNNELYYGMEQIGWDGLTKPKVMYRDRFTTEPPLPQRSEGQEVEDMLREGLDVREGNRDPEDLPATSTVGGVLLPRPFRVVGIGPLGLFVQDMAASVAFYTDTMGFTETERADVLGLPAAFLRAGTEHHSLALYPMELKDRLGVPAESTCAVLGLRLGSYQQLRDAVAFLRSHGVPVFDAPLSFHTGTDYAAHVLDPDGHLIRLYHAMEHVDWSGCPRPAALRRATPLAQWPDLLDDGVGAFATEVHQGPLG